MPEVSMSTIHLLAAMDHVLWRATLPTNDVARLGGKDHHHHWRPLPGPLRTPKVLWGCLRQLRPLRLGIMEQIQNARAYCRENFGGTTTQTCMTR